MNMKMKALVVACSMALAGQAMALTPAVVAADATAGTLVTLKLSGSSALQNAISEVSEDLCQSGTIDEFWDGTATTASGSNFRAVACTAKTTGSVVPGLIIPTSIGGKPLLIYDTAKGGSIYGVNPVATGSLVGFVDYTTCGSSSVTTNSLTHEPVWTCTGSLNTATDAGISDVEPATMEAPVNLTVVAGVPVFSALTSAQLASLKVSAVVGQVFGVTVNGTTAMGSASPATAPMLAMTKAQVAAIMSGNTSDWAMIDPSIGTGNSIMVICRRQSGSGSQASLNAGIMGNPCSSTNLPPLMYSDSQLANGIGSTSPALAADVVVVENSSTGNLGHCMTYAQKGGVTGTYAGLAIDLTTGAIGAPNANSVVLPGAATTPTYAIGIIGLDHGVGSDWYQNTALNGNAPSLASAVAGTYDLVVESTWNRPAAMAAGAKLDLYTTLVKEVSSPVVLGGGVAGGQVVPGILALSENHYAASATFTASNPVIRVGNFGNTCRPLQQLQ